MPRDSSGNYTLPLGNPVVDGTIIDVNWANPTMNDIAVQLNNVLTRDGLLGPIAPFFIVDGTEALPGLAFISQNGTGLWRDAVQMGLSVGGVAKQVWSSAGSQINGGLAVTGNFNVTGELTTGQIVVNSSGSSYGTFNHANAANSYLVFSTAGVPYGIIGNAPGVTTGPAGGLAIRSEANLDFSAGGVGADMTIAGATGNVGIGVTPSANVRLHIRASGEIVRLETTAAIGACYLAFHKAAGLKGYIGYGSGVNEAFIIQNAEPNGDILLFPNRNVGIGESTPGYKLQVNGSIATSVTNGAATGYHIGQSGVSSWDWFNFAGDTGVSMVDSAGGPVLTRQYWSATGNVGIGRFGVAFQPPNALSVISGPPNGFGVYRDFDTAGGPAGVYADFGARIGATLNVASRITGALLLNGAGGRLIFDVRNTAGALNERMSITEHGTLQRRWQYAGGFGVAPVVVVDLNLILPGAATTGASQSTLIHVAGSENGGANQTFGLWMCVKRDAGFSVIKVQEVIFGSNYGTPILSVVGNNLMVISGSGAAVGGWQVSFSSFAS